MQNKGLIGLIAVTAVAVAVAVLVARGGGAPKDDPLVGTRVLPEIGQRLDGVARIALVRGDIKTTLVRKGDAWNVEEKGGYAANATKVHQAILGLADLAFVEPKTKKSDLYPRLELEDADKKGAKSTLVTVSDDKGSLLGEIIAGKRSVDALGGGNDGLYVRKPGDAQSWLARGTLDLSGDTAGWLETKLLDVPADQVKSVTLTAPDGASFTFTRLKQGDALALATPPPAGKKLKSDSALDEPAGALAGLELSDVQPAKDMTFPPGVVAGARYETFDGLVVTVSLVNKDGTEWARIAATGSGDAQARAADLGAKLSPWVFGLPTYKTKLLRTKLDDLLEAAKGS
ncbi:MAG TPA: DUF4340 domain-containing protein [Stellaceae bacterium]|nr:DUF4340 domain-containing protein [Stellaceae bacterium]